MWFGVDVYGVDIGVAVYQTDQIVCDTILDEVMASMDVARLARDSYCQSQLDRREVIYVDGGRVSLWEADGCKVVSEPEEETCDGCQAVVLRCTGVNGRLVLGVGLGEEGCRL